MVKFSVVIPTYESSGVIGRAIDSLNRQTYKEFEVLFVDDRSRDYEGLRKVVESTSGFKYSILQLTRHVNQVESRKVGIAAASGDFVCFLDHDDFWEPRKLDLLHSLIESERFSSEKIFYHQLRCQGNDGREFFYPRRGIAPRESVAEYLFVSNGMMQSSALAIPISIAKNLPFNSDAVPHDDWDLVLQAYKQGVSFRYIDHALATWSVRRMIGVSPRDSSDVSLRWFAQRVDLFDKAGTVGFLLNVVFPKQVAEKKYSAALGTLFTSFRLQPLFAGRASLSLARRFFIKFGAR
ncbi:MAG: hypothetical protein DI530_18095 [Sphingomonas sp.]|uniref:Glycosyltransferase 2-like domain-containing protein n=1 Tax=Variovorax paradoxus TaxID=34073 RepID=A0A2W5Q586_VARPD|nr:glycosyltransferase family 2 protein [Sphingomonas sp.]PZQ69845.1 MAG: hypothetical protein DI563_19090 [Variovorax paradoxus]PZU72458.1 MAG: hypothetical protein DI530_18095 [Sphingomonas sp.]